MYLWFSGALLGRQQLGAERPGVRGRSPRGAGPSPRSCSWSVWSLPGSPSPARGEAGNPRSLHSPACPAMATREPAWPSREGVPTPRPLCIIPISANRKPRHTLHGEFPNWVLRGQSSQIFSDLGPREWCPSLDTLGRERHVRLRGGTAVQDGWMTGRSPRSKRDGRWEWLVEGSKARQPSGPKVDPLPTAMVSLQHQMAPTRAARDAD